MSRGLDQGLEVRVVLCLCEVRSWIICVGPGICVLCLADTCASEVHPVKHHPVAPYGYQLPNMYLLIAAITHPDLFVCDVVRHGLVSTSPDFVRSSASHTAGPHGRFAQKQ